jgi:hypothetical protein
MAYKIIIPKIKYRKETMLQQATS